MPETENIMGVETGDGESTKQTINVDISEDYFGGEGASPSAKDMREDIEKGIVSLSEGKALAPEIKTCLIEQLHKPLGRNTFALTLEKYTKPTQLDSWDCFIHFSELVNTLLTAFVKEKDYNYNTLRIVLQTGRNIYTKKGVLKIYMFTQLASHGIWQGIERWQRLIDSAIDAKIREVREGAERLRKRQADRISNAGGVTPAYMFTKKRASEEEDYTRMLTSSVTNVLQQFSFYLVNYKVELEKAKLMIQRYGRRYKIDPKKLFEMEIELQIQQPPSSAYRSVRDHIISKHSKLLDVYKKNKYHIPLVMAIPYIGDLTTLRALLILNKSLGETLKVPVARSVLLGPRAGLLPLRVRLQLWALILNTVFLCQCLQQCVEGVRVRLRGYQAEDSN